MNYRNHMMTKAEVTRFRLLLETIPPRSRKHTVIVAVLQKFPKILAKYEAHVVKHDITHQERCAIFSGQVGKCQAPGCDNYTKWSRCKGYARFCCAKCWGPSAVEGRRKTCLAKYGVPHISKVAKIQASRVQTLRALYKGKLNLGSSQASI